MSFLTAYFDVIERDGEVSVCCPFPHSNALQIEYFETHPSAHINSNKGLFHCTACDRGFSEPNFIKTIFDIDYAAAMKIKNVFETTEDHAEWLQETTLTEESKQRALDLGISAQVIDELMLRTPAGEGDLICFPVFMFDTLCDIRTYNPGHRPKVRSRTDAPSGLVIPFDIWRKTNPRHLTLICAGEKDMAIARSHGLNAITLTGGEQALTLTPTYFKDRPVAIVYDNDETGISGAKRLATQLLQYTSDVRVVLGFHEICTNKGEDIHDFFVKYAKTKDDLAQYIRSTPIYVPTEADRRTQYKIMDLQTAIRPENIGQMVQSNIQVVAISEATYMAPAYAEATKFQIAGKNDTVPEGTKWSWNLTDETVHHLLHLMDNNFKEDAIKDNLKNLMKVPYDERCVTVKTIAKATIYKVFVADMFETNDDSSQPMEFTAYAINCKLESGKKYMVTHKIVPHPYKGQQLTMLITSASQADDSVSNFKITDPIKQKLAVIRNLPGSVEERMHLLSEKVKGILGYNGINQLITTIDLAYHTVLQFNFGTFKNIRGYLDTIIVSESRIGKSSTADALRNVYKLGTFTSLAGNSATIPGLVGGSNKTANGFQTRAGLIPQNHKGLIIFEEFGKSKNDIITELTDIRSSNEVRIARVSGTIVLPALVRMISLTNVKSDGNIRPIASYPNGITILSELVPTAEDIARYDIMLVLADKGANNIDPLWQPEEPFPTDVYQARVRWIWSRTPDQINIPQDVILYIMEKANQLNTIYECHIKIFGTEAWKKISRLAIAIAGYLVSTDDEYTSIIVTKEHVDYAIDFLVKLYDNPTFKLKEYVDHEKRYSQVDEDGITRLQDMFAKAPGLILQLEQTGAASRTMLGGATGMSNDELNKALQQLARGFFVRFDNYNVLPTERFRMSVAKIERRMYVPGLGEQ